MGKNHIKDYKRITNIKINYMILEQCLIVPGIMNQLCKFEELVFLKKIFKIARKGELFKDDRVNDYCTQKITEITGVSSKYWDGTARIKLNIRCKDKDLVTGDSINTVEFDEITANDMDYYHKLLSNPLNIEWNYIYQKINNLNISDETDVITEKSGVFNIIEQIYSLNGLIAIIMYNMSTNGYDESLVLRMLKSDLIYKNEAWYQFMRKLDNPTSHGISFCPKYLEINRGLIQKIIVNLNKLDVTFSFNEFIKKIENFSPK